MTMTRAPNETSEQRAERLAVQRAKAAIWEDAIRRLPTVPTYPETIPPLPAPEAP